MPTKRTLDQIKQKEFLKMSELTELTGVRYSTIKYYGELGFCLMNKKEKDLPRYYPRIEATQRLEEILKLREQGKTITDIIGYFIRKDKEL